MEEKGEMRRGRGGNQRDDDIGRGGEEGEERKNMGKRKERSESGVVRTAEKEEGEVRRESSKRAHKRVKRDGDSDFFEKEYNALEDALKSILQMDVRSLSQKMRQKKRGKVEREVRIGEGGIGGSEEISSSSSSALPSLSGLSSSAAQRMYTLRFDNLLVHVQYTESDCEIVKVSLVGQDGDDNDTNMCNGW